MNFDSSMPILVVDDYQTMVRIIRNLLKQLGFENVDEASDGSEALGKMRERRYGLIISDWNMQPMTGYDLLKQVRSDRDLVRLLDTVDIDSPIPLEAFQAVAEILSYIYRRQDKLKPPKSGEKRER